MKKVLYICPSAGIGGAETFIKQTFSNANIEEFQNHYLLFQTGPLYKSLSNMGASVHLINQVPRLSRTADRKLVSEKIMELINEHNIDLVHSTMAYGALFSAWACKQLRVPHVWFQHGPASGWMDRLAAVLYHQGLVVNSHYTGKKQRQLENPVRFFIPRQIPIEKILLGTDVLSPSPEDIKAHRMSLFAQLGLSSDTLLIAMLCRIQEWKGPHIFIDAMARLRAEKNVDTPFHAVIWGEPFKDEKYLNSLKERVEKEKLPVSFLGRTENPGLSLASIDMVVNASIQPEPFGLSIIEGMMMKTIPIVPDVGGPVEIVSNGKNGLTFHSGNAGALMRQLRTLLSDKGLRETLSDQAQTTAETKFTAKRAIQQLETFHLKVLG